MIKNFTLYYIMNVRKVSNTLSQKPLHIFFTSTTTPYNDMHAHTS